MLNIEIAEFWLWFRQNSNSLISDNFDYANLLKLDETISAWGFSWEIGPGGLKKNFLAISTNGDNLNNLENSTKLEVMDIVIMNLLGEKRKIETIEFVSIIENDESSSTLTNIEYLPSHLNLIFNKNQ